MEKTLDIRCWPRWREEYRARPYLKHCSDFELKERHALLLKNINRISFAGDISPIEGKPKLLLEKRLFEIFEELVVRNINPTKWIEEKGYVLTAPVRKPRTKVAEIEKFLSKRDRLYKFGKFGNLKKSLQQGCFYFSAASAFDSADLTSAQRDKELDIPFRGHDDSAYIELMEGDKIGEKLPIAGNFDFTEFLKRDYFICCFTSTLDQRFAKDFDADAVLVIREVAIFIDLICKSLEEKFGTEAIVEYGPVEYVDQFFPRNEKNDISFQKRLEYFYQQEYRVASYPINMRNKDNFFLHIGPICHFAEVVKL